MADRYWVGGTASWDGTAGTKWAATSGGPGGETVPTSADDVFFDANSTGTVTIATGNTGAKSINCTGFTGTLTGTAGISVAGSITLVAGMTYTHTGTVTFTGTGTLITAGKTFSGITVNAAGITLTLGDALDISTRTINITKGSFDTANYSVIAGFLSSSVFPFNTRSISLGSSTVTLSGGFNVINFALSTNLTFNAGTSEIILTSNSAYISGGGRTFYNVSFTSTSAKGVTITQSNTFNNITVDPATSITGRNRIFFLFNQTINGTFSCQGNSPRERSMIVGGTYNQITLTVNSLLADYCDFQNIAITGAAAPASPVNAGNAGNTNGITYPSAKTVYRVGTDTTWAGSASWALTSGGTGSNDNFPLPQDTAVIDNSTTLTGTLTTDSSYNMSTLDCTNRTNSITLSHSSTYWFGSYKLGSGVTVIVSGVQYFIGYGNHGILTAGKNIPFVLDIDREGLNLKLEDAYTSTSYVQLRAGTFDADVYNYTGSGFRGSGVGSNTQRIVYMGSGLWTLTGGIAWEAVTALTVVKETANILLTGTFTTSFNTAGESYNKLTIGTSSSSFVLTLGTTSDTSAGSFTEIASTSTVAYRIALAYPVNITKWTAKGSSGNLLTLNSSVAGTRRNITLTEVTDGIDYMSIKDIGETSGNKFYAGNNSTDGGNNLNIYFTDAPKGSGNMFMLF